jgi:hypothetical protein
MTGSSEYIGIFAIFSRHFCPTGGSSDPRTEAQLDSGD